MTSAQHPQAAHADAATPAVHFRITDFPERDRFEAWREILGRAIIKVEFERMRDRRYSADMTCGALPDLKIVSGRFAGLLAHHTPALTESDDLFLHISLGGGLREHKHDIEIGKGGAMLFSSDNVCRCSF